jgi:hypothetical protein
MSVFVKKNERLLKFYNKMPQTMGPVMLACSIAWGVFGATQLLSRIRIGGDWKTFDFAFHAGPFQAGTMFFLGLILIVVAQFIRYLFNTEYQPGWILRHGEKILYAYAFLIFVHALVFIKQFLMGQYFFHTSCEALEVCNALTYCLIRLSIVLILIGSGQLLRRILPAIKESKTLA